MENKKLDLSQNGKISIRNDGVTAKQTPMTLQEARLLRLVIMQIKQEDDALLVYETTIPELARFLGLQNVNTIHDDIYKICDKLTSRRIAVTTKSTKQPYSFQPWMATAEFDGSILTLALNERIRAYVLDFHNLFTQYEMIDILRLRSYYALRIYEILKMKYTSCYKNKKTFDFTIEELREMTGTENKFRQIGHFRDKVINIAEREINDKTDISVKVEEIKKSRRYIGFRFIVTEKSKVIEVPDPEQQPAAPISANEPVPIPGQVNLADVYKVKELLDYKAIPCTIEQAEQLFLAYNSEVNEQFLNNLDYVSKNKRIKNRVAYLLKISHDNIAKEADITQVEPMKSTHKSRKKKVETLEPMSESRKQAYLDLEVKYTEDLWHDLPVDEELEEETGSNLEEEYRNAAKKLKIIVNEKE